MSSSQVSVAAIPRATEVAASANSVASTAMMPMASVIAAARAMPNPAFRQIKTC